MPTDTKSKKSAGGSRALRRIEKDVWKPAHTAVFRKALSSDRRALSPVIAAWQRTRSRISAALHAAAAREGTMMERAIDVIGFGHCVQILLQFHDDPMRGLDLVDSQPIGSCDRLTLPLRSTVNWRPRPLLLCS
ncbi:hypothetical protein VSR34_17570 [Paraburkholderia sp. JHI2823]|uniref:hypothetical protein n=1 Tax=Paraburkholderia sp. JHI2823 TaxID=3112960 RepID=UPI00316F0116